MNDSMRKISLSCGLLALMMVSTSCAEPEEDQGLSQPAHDRSIDDTDPLRPRRPSFDDIRRNVSQRVGDLYQKARDRARTYLNPTAGKRAQRVSFNPSEKPGDQEMTTINQKDGNIDRPRQEVLSANDFRDVRDDDKPRTEPSSSPQHNATRAVTNVVDWLNSTKIVSWFNRIGNHGRELRQASQIASSASPDFTNHFKDLTIKEKQAVANLWVKARVTKVQETKQRLQTAETTRNNREQINQLRAELKDAETHLLQDCRELSEKIQSTLSSNEVVVMRTAPADELFDQAGNSSLSTNLFEIIDMSRINPKLSIQEQYQSLTKSGLFGMRAADVAYTSPTELLREYSSWVVRSSSIDPSRPIMEQLVSGTQDLTATRWSDMSRSIKDAIMIEAYENITRSPGNGNRLMKKQLQTFTKEFNQSITSMPKDAIAMLPTKIIETSLSKLSKEQFQALTPDQISTLNVQLLDKNTLSYLTKDQLQALNPDQISKLTQQQLIDITKNMANLTADQISALTTRQLQGMLFSQIQQLTPPQIQSLTIAQIQTLDSTQIEALTDQQVQALSIKQLKGMKRNQINPIFNRLTPQQQHEYKP